MELDTKMYLGYVLYILTCVYELHLCLYLSCHSVLCTSVLVFISLALLHSFWRLWLAMVNEETFSVSQLVGDIRITF
jgi:hypothetical protein